MLSPCSLGGKTNGHDPSQRNGYYTLDVVDKLEEETMPKVEAYMNAKIAAGKNNGCTLATAGVRREWYV